MKTIVLSFFLSFLMLTGFAQEKTKQQLKEEKKLAQQKEVDEIINSKEFEFEGQKAYPQGGRTIDLTTNANYLRFKNDSIYSEMPFFGRAYSGVAYGGGGGLDFKGAIKNYSVEKKEKKYIIKGEVRDASDNYTVYLTVFFDKGASMTISSNNRASINYSGRIEKLKKKE